MILKQSIFLLFGIIACSFTQSCTPVLSSNLTQSFQTFSELGISEAEITGKFSTTEYKASLDENNVRTAILTHNNPWLTKVRFVRTTTIDGKPVLGKEQ